MNENNFIFSKFELVNMIKDLYKEKYNTDISKIKLHKSLFFLFGYWGADAKEYNRDIENSDTEIEGEKLRKLYLFDSKFEAWKYGPVDVEVYRDDIVENEKIVADESEKLEAQKFVKEFSKELFERSDFGLVDLTHTFICWKSKYKIENIINNERIYPDEIIEEMHARRYRKI